MPQVNLLNPHNWSNIVAASNTAAMAKLHQYPLFERPFFIDCLEYLPINCNVGCFCRLINNNSAWVTRGDLRFNTFLSHFVNLWARGSVNIINNVQNNQHVQSRRYGNAVAILIALAARWNNWNDNGDSLPTLINRHRKTYFCDNSFEEIAPLINEIIQVCQADTTGVYTSKIISQLFPDIAVPFDTASRREMIQSGYTPNTYGNGILKNAILDFIKRHGMTMNDFRRLDNAPTVHWMPTSIPTGITTSCSRVIDKLFY